MWRPLPTSTGFFFVPGLLANPRVSSWKAAECDGKGTELGIRRGVLVLNTAPQEAASVRSFPKVSLLPSAEWCM